MTVAKGTAPDSSVRQPNVGSETSLEHAAGWAGLDDKVDDGLVDFMVGRVDFFGATV
jgi:hypothetical protein